VRKQVQNIYNVEGRRVKLRQNFTNGRAETNMSVLDEFHYCGGAKQLRDGRVPTNIRRVNGCGVVLAKIFLAHSAVRENFSAARKAIRRALNFARVYYALKMTVQNVEAAFVITRFAWRYFNFAFRD
jgi:hypothetical protein